MADHVRPAVDFKTAVLPLPNDQKPYGDIDMPRDVQAILWHYGVKKPEVEACIAEGYGSAADFQFADPYATDAESKAMFKAIADRVKGKLQLRKLRGAISRILAKDPLAAIEETANEETKTPPKKRKRDENNEAPAADAAGASDASKSSKTPKLKSSSKRSFKDDSSDSSSDDSSNSDDDDDREVDDSKESSSKASSSKSKSLDALFNSVANQVSSLEVSDSHSCLSCCILWAVVFSSHINIFACPCITCFVIFRESAVVGRSLSKHATPIRR